MLIIIVMFDFILGNTRLNDLVCFKSTHMTTHNFNTESANFLNYSNIKPYNSTVYKGTSEISSNQTAI